MVDTSDNLFSAGYRQEDPEAWGEDIARAFRELKRLAGGNVRCVYWNKGYVAAAFAVQVNLPSGGPVGGIDIRPVEPVMLVFSRRDYPEKAPMIRSDRKDFPVSRLPHLNPVEPGQPPSLCPYRGSFDDWFAEHTLEDVIKRIKGWLEDAAANRLIPPGDQFEPTRLIDRLGSFIFTEQGFQGWLDEGWKATNGKAGYGFLMMRLLNPESEKVGRYDALSFKVEFFFQRGLNPSGIVELLKRDNRQARGHQSDLSCIGILTWTDRNHPIKEYFGELPVTNAGLLYFCERNGIALGDALREYAGNGFAALKFIPVVVGIKRPQRLLNSELSVEPLCFLVDASQADFTNKGTIAEDAEIYLFGHRSPLDPEKAKRISGVENRVTEGRTLLFGNGALGSKMALHFGRSGQPALTLVDHRNLSPHNLVRNGLLGDAVGKNKAEAVRDAIAGIYESGFPANAAPTAFPDSALEWIKGAKKAELSKHSLLIDATASGMVLEALVNASLPDELKIVRCGISDSGNIGTLLIEGRKRNPRVDDLQALIYDLAIEQPALQGWLNRERERSEEVGFNLAEVPVGVGCASDTLQLADDVVSWHAAVFSISLRTRIQNASKGQIILSHAAVILPNESASLPGLQHIAVEPLTIIRPEGAKDWQIRIHMQAATAIRDQFHSAYPNETGGTLIGFVHSKRRAVYVTRVVEPPPDSEGTTARFRRGVFRLSETVKQIQQASDGLLGYVGEWHSHPNGSGQPSQRDRETMDEIRIHLEPQGLPTLMLIVNNKRIYAYIGRVA